MLRPIPGLSFVGTSAVTPSLIARWDGPNGISWPFVLYTSKKPHVRINFHWMTCVSEADKVKLANALSELPESGINATEVIAKGFKSRPSLFVVDSLSDAAAQAAFAGAMQTLMSPGTT